MQGALGTQVPPPRIIFQNHAVFGVKAPANGQVSDF